jgi:low affinity Fe/Cu permease
MAQQALLERPIRPFRPHWRQAHRAGGGLYAALLIVAVWLITGPLFGFSDTWQLVINTATTITTFLRVFVIQHTQNRDTDALQVKLDELIRAVEGANNALLDLEEMEEEELELLRARYADLARQAREEIPLRKAGENR